MFHTPDKLFRTEESLGFRLRVLLLAKTEQLIMDPKLFGMHSLPAGGAIANSGVPGRLFKLHGCWRSEWMAFCAAKAIQKLWCVCSRMKHDPLKRMFSTDTRQIM